MIDARFVPIGQWPGTTTRAKKRSPFRGSYHSTLDLLEDELRHLKATEIVIQVDLSREEIRNDGWPRSSARPRSAGVIVSFQSKTGTMSFPCDRFDDWQANLRAIALSLEALRRVDRYGVTRGSEQYRGWTALPPPSNVNPIFVIARFSELSIDDARRDPHAAYRSAAKKTHPDHGGSADDFRELQAAYDELKRKEAL